MPFDRFTDRATGRRPAARRRPPSRRSPRATTGCCMTTEEGGAQAEGVPGQVRRRPRAQRLDRLAGGDAGLLPSATTTSSTRSRPASSTASPPSSPTSRKSPSATQEPGRCPSPTELKPPSSAELEADDRPAQDGARRRRRRSIGRGAGRLGEKPLTPIGRLDGPRSRPTATSTGGATLKIARRRRRSWSDGKSPATGRPTRSRSRPTGRASRPFGWKCSRRPRLPAQGPGPRRQRQLRPDRVQGRRRPSRAKPVDRSSDASADHSQDELPRRLGDRRQRRTPAGPSCRRRARPHEAVFELETPWPSAKRTSTASRSTFHSQLRQQHTLGQVPALGDRPTPTRPRSAAMPPPDRPRGPGDRRREADEAQRRPCSAYLPRRSPRARSRARRGRPGRPRSAARPSCAKRCPRRWSSQRRRRPRMTGPAPRQLARRVGRGRRAGACPSSSAGRDAGPDGQPARPGPLAGLARQPADRPGLRQPALEAGLRPGAGRRRSTTSARRGPGPPTPSCSTGWPSSSSTAAGTSRRCSS